MNLRFVLFISILSSILIAASIYLGKRAITLFPWAARHPFMVWFTVAAFIILQIGGPALYRHFPSRTSWPFALQWLTYGTLGLFTVMFVYALAADLVVWLWHFFPSHPADYERRAFIGMGIASFASWGIGIYQALKDPTVYRVDIPIAGLPKEFDGYTIAQVSDVHIGPLLGRSFMERIVAITNGLDADAIALTGDFIDGEVAELKDATAPLAGLRSKDGIFFVTGNHEYYWGAPAWIQEFQRHGIRHLLNEHVVISRGEARLVLAGSPDEGADRMLPDHRFDPAGALNGAPANARKILLTHRPSRYREIAAAGYDLTLNGHTHGGQFFPWTLAVAAAHKYYIGLNRFENLWVYVNRGTGYWGPPVRFTVPSEITHIRLRST